MDGNLWAPLNPRQDHRDIQVHRPGAIRVYRKIVDRTGQYTPIYPWRHSLETYLELYNVPKFGSWCFLISDLQGVSNKAGDQGGFPYNLRFWRPRKAQIFFYLKVQSFGIPLLYPFITNHGKHLETRKSQMFWLVKIQDLTIHLEWPNPTTLKNPAVCNRFRHTARWFFSWVLEKKTHPNRYVIHRLSSNISLLEFLLGGVQPRGLEFAGIRVYSKSFFSQKVPNLDHKATTQEATKYFDHGPKVVESARSFKSQGGLRYNMLTSFEYIG